MPESTEERPKQGLFVHLKTNSTKYQNYRKESQIYIQFSSSAQAQSNPKMQWSGEFELPEASVLVLIGTCGEVVMKYLNEGWRMFMILFLINKSVSGMK